MNSPATTCEAPSPALVSPERSPSLVCNAFLASSRYWVNCVSLILKLVCSQVLIVSIPVPTCAAICGKPPVNWLPTRNSSAPIARIVARTVSAAAGAGRPSRARSHWLTGFSIAASSTATMTGITASLTKPSR
ncbi:MAG: hypothetical protein BWY91_02416 [bacterium ADurb.BinA028]|nr:MAG: hypothetical protein BWY91_02416 [bacterium ADurb.BinA028]